MANTFGATVLVAIVLGFLFPYTALALNEYGFVFLSLLMFFSGFSVRWSRLRELPRRPKALLTGLALSFLFVPFLQWSLASLIIDNDRLVAGALFAALMPVALVAPYFTSKNGGDTELAYALMLVSTLLTPLIAPAVLYSVEGMELPIRMGPLMLSIGLFTLLPFALSALAEKFWPALGEKVKGHLGVLNAVTLGALVFILFGSVVMKLNMNYVPPAVVGQLLGLAVIQDFGVYFLALALLRLFLAPPEAVAIAISVAMKNVAISAGVLLFYDPRAALPSALAFVAHGFFFAWVGRVR